MLKKTLLLFFCLFALATAKAQTAEDVYNEYLDFNLARLETRTDNAMELAQKILPDTAKLKDKTRISFFYSLGKLYEDDSQSIKALEYYEKVAAAVPNYYVVRRALGYIYANKADELEKSKLFGDTYTAAAKKAILNLEKAQACDPDDDTLALIRKYYKNINDTKGASTLNTRLAALSKNCIDLLDDK